MADNSKQIQDRGTNRKHTEETGCLPKLKKEPDGKTVCEGGSETWQDAVKVSTGTSEYDVAKKLLMEVASTFRLSEDQTEAINEGLALMHGIGPRDELEGMLAAQMVGIHNAAMMSLQRAVLPDQTDVRLDANVNRATKLLRTFSGHVEALNRYRSKGQQTVKVEHVHVSEGGQAIVGNVHHEGGGDDEKQT